MKKDPKYSIDANFSSSNIKMSSSSEECHKKCPKKSNKPSSGNKPCLLEHSIQLQLFDSFGTPVAGTEFWVNLTVVKNGPQVTVQLPVINFQTGPSDFANLLPPPLTPDLIPLKIPGGYLYTVDGYLPVNLRPNDLVYRSIVAAANDGQTLPYNFTQPVSTLPKPPAGYIVSITNQGGIAVQCAGTFGNIIPPGPHILMPCDITYIPKPCRQLSKNFIIAEGFTNTTEFPGAVFSPVSTGAAASGVRDSHVNDAYNGVVAWAWTDNSNQTDKTNEVMNVIVRTGKVKNGKVTLNPPTQLTNLTSPNFAWDTAVAINRTDQNNIVVSWSLLNGPGTPYRAVSFDGGVTWPINGPTNIQPPTGNGDNRGVASDKYGNIWYSTTNLFVGEAINVPTFWVSTNKGVDYTVVFNFPATPGIFWDFPQYCFGGDGNGNYGLWFICDYIDTATDNQLPTVGFIPINGPGQIGTVQFANLTGLPNVATTNGITASEDGKVFTLGSANGFGPTFAPGPGSAITALRVLYKSPGALTDNWAGPWDFIIANLLPDVAFVPVPQYLSQPVFGYFNSFRTNIYDDKRQALYQTSIGLYPDFSQNMRLYFSISRDNGQTWSSPIDIATTDKNNRGFQSMALDPVTGDLLFGWYDGRNDPTQKSLQYFGAIITAKQLDALVDAIPLSNPTFNLGSAVGPTGSVQPAVQSNADPKNLEQIRNNIRLKRSRFARLNTKQNI